MASIHRQAEKSPYWYAAFYGADGRRRFQSTKTIDRKKAQAIALEFEEAARLGRSGALTMERARRVIANLYAVANRETLPASTIKDYMDSWLQKKTLEVADATIGEYQRLTADLLDYLGTKERMSMDALTPAHLVGYRARLAARVSAATANKALKILRGCWAQAVKDGVIERNPFLAVDLVKRRASDRTQRRGFTLEELRKLLAACDDSWTGLVLAGLYTGQRLMDLVSLRWGQVELSERIIHFTTAKTGRRIDAPIHPSLMRWLMDHAGDDADGPLFPELHGLAGGTISNQFIALLARAGIRAQQGGGSHAKRKQGRSARRETGELSFHSLRHTYVSQLKISGVADGTARALVGHESAAVNNAYTHFDAADLARAVNRLPDITKAGTP